MLNGNKLVLDLTKIVQESDIGEGVLLLFVTLVEGDTETTFAITKSNDQVRHEFLPDRDDPLIGTA